MSGSFYRNKFMLGTIPQMSGVSRNRGRDVKHGVVGYDNLNFKDFIVDDRTNDGWTLSPTTGGGSTVVTGAPGYWKGVTTDGTQMIYKNNLGLKKCKIVMQTVADGTDAGRGSSNEMKIYDSNQVGNSDTGKYFSMNRSLFGSSSGAQNLYRPYTRDGASQVFLGDIASSPLVIGRQELVFDNGAYTYTQYENNVLLSTKTGTLPFSTVQSVGARVHCTTGSKMMIDQVSLYY